MPMGMFRVGLVLAVAAAVVGLSGHRTIGGVAWLAACAVMVSAPVLKLAFAGRRS